MKIPIKFSTKFEECLKIFHIYHINTVFFNYVMKKIYENLGNSWYFTWFSGKNLQSKINQLLELNLKYKVTRVCRNKLYKNARGKESGSFLAKYRSMLQEFQKIRNFWDLLKHKNQQKPSRTLNRTPCLKSYVLNSFKRPYVPQKQLE